MKIIKSFLLITACLCATNLLHAQEAKTTPVKPADITAKPLTAPPLQPGSTVVPQTAVENVQAIPSDQKEENIKTPVKEKADLKTVDAKPTTEIKKEPVIIQPVLLPNTNDQKPAPVIRSAAKQQQ